MRAQSRVSETEGYFLSSRVRSERTIRAIWSASSSVTPGTRVSTMSRSRSSDGIVEMQVQAPPLERLRQLPRVVRREEHERDLLGPDRAELGDRHLVLRQHLEQQRLGLELDPVHLVDEEDDGLGRADRLEQRPGEEELLGEDVLLEVAPRASAGSRAGRGSRGPGSRADASSSTTRWAWMRSSCFL